MYMGVILVRVLVKLLPGRAHHVYGGDPFNKSIDFNLK